MSFLSKARARLTPLLIPTFVLIVLVHEFLTTPVYTERELSSMREKAVGMAAKGQIDAAIEQLRALSEVAPKDRNVWGDYLTVLTRTGHGSEAIDLAKASPQRPLPDYALAALFEMAIQLRDFDAARAFAAREVAQSADAQSVAAARERSLRAAEIPVAETGPALAEKSAIVVPPVAQIDTPNPTWRAGEAKSANRSGSGRVGVAIEKKPAPSANEAAAVNLTAVAAQTPASTLLAEQARQAVREAEQAAPADRVVSALTALIFLDRYEQSLFPHSAMTAEPSSVELRNEKLDRVRALTLANHLDEAALLFESLDGEQPLPLYGLMNGADLYARKHEPERAAELLERAGRLAPQSQQVLQARFYNQLDLEKYDDAKQTLNSLQALSTTSSEQRDTQMLAAMFAAYRNRLQQAQFELEKIRDADPENTDVRLKLAQIYRWRGWPQRALDEYRAVEPALADPTPAQVGSIASLVDQHQFAQARAILRELAVAEPNHPDVIQAREDEHLRNLSDYSAQILTGQSSDNPVIGNADLAFEQRLYLPPIADQYRVFAHQRYDWADLPEGQGSANRMGVGGDYRSQFFDGALELSDRMPGGHIGATFSGEWRPDDNWGLFTEVQSDSTSVPLRALHAGIDGESIALGARFRADEIHSARFAYSRTNFSDGNDRDAFSANYRQTFYRTEKHQLTAIGQAYYATNTAGSNVIYYNPSSESALGATLEYSGILSRRYERSWSQRFAVGAGSYAQQDFGSGAIWDAEYEQRWQFSKVFGINYGVLYRSRIYDGSREFYSALFAGVNWRF